MIRMFTRLAPLDARSIGRDGLMRILPALPLLVVVPVRFVLPVLLLRLGDVFGTPLDAYYPGIASAALLLISPALYGLMVGFLLLDQRDENTLTALRVTPLPVRSYLLYRLAAPTALGYVVSVAALLLAGLPQCRHCSWRQWWLRSTRRWWPWRWPASPPTKCRAWP